MSNAHRRSQTGSISSIAGVLSPSTSPTEVAGENPTSTGSSNEGNVQVVLRIRPTTPHDLSTIPPRFQRISLFPTSSTSITVDPAGAAAAVPSSSSGSKRNQNLQYHYDRVLGPDEGQKDLYQAAAEGLVGKFLQGFNVTILAYGQTSSGKSYSMGTAIDIAQATSFDITPETGLVPRAVADIFSRCAELERQAGGKQNFKYEAVCSFIELYNEDLLDLLADSDPSSRPPVNIREDKGQIIWSGLKEVRVSSKEDVMANLRQGSLLRRTNETDMNATSSRSHAIFSLTLTQRKRVGFRPSSPPSSSSSSSSSNPFFSSTNTTLNGVNGFGLSLPSTPNRMLPRPGSMMGSRTMSPTPISRPSTPSSLPLPKGSGLKPLGPSINGAASRVVSPALSGPKHARRLSGMVNVLKDEEGDTFEGFNGKEKDSGDWVTVTSKFNFVDLAGSERLKRTAAQGERMKEGISINSGLLALGNVISTLGDPSKAKAKGATHIPYRDSKLTRLLQDSLGGNAHTLMIACVSPTEYNLTETLSTIKYANRARNIKNLAKINEQEAGWDDLEHLQAALIKLRKEHAALKAAASSAEMALSTEGNASASTDSVLTEGIKSSPATGSSFVRLSSQVSDLTEKNADMSDRYHSAMTEIARLRREVEEARLGGHEASTGFAEMVQPVIEEYEKAISGLETELKLSRAALAHTNEFCNDQELQISNLHLLQAQADAYTAELRDRIHKLSDRESLTETLIFDLEAKIKSYADGEDTASTKMSELKDEIAQLKKLNTDTTEQIVELNLRLAQADESNEGLTTKVDNLEKEVKRREVMCQELEIRLASVDTSDENKRLLAELDQKSSIAAALQQELTDSIEGMKQLGKERSLLLQQAKQTEAERQLLQEKLAESQNQSGDNAPAASETSSSKIPEIVLHGQDTSPDTGLVQLSTNTSTVDSLERQLQDLQITHATTLVELETISLKYRDALKEIGDLAKQVDDNNPIVGSRAIFRRSVSGSSVSSNDPAKVPRSFSRSNSSESVSPGPSSRQRVGGDRRRDSVPILSGSNLITPSSSGQGFGLRGSGQQQSMLMSPSQELSSSQPSRSNWAGMAPSLLTTSPVQTTSAKIERSAQSFEDEIMSLQNSLRSRDTEISQLENDLRSQLSASTSSSPFVSSSNSDGNVSSASHTSGFTAPSSIDDSEQQRSVVNELMKSMAQKDTFHREANESLQAEVDKLRRENAEMTALNRDQALNVSAELESLRKELVAVEDRSEDLTNQLEKSHRREQALASSEARTKAEHEKHLASQSDAARKQAQSSASMIRIVRQELAQAKIDHDEDKIKHGHMAVKLFDEHQKATDAFEENIRNLNKSIQAQTALHKVELDAEIRKRSDLQRQLEELYSAQSSSRAEKILIQTAHQKEVQRLEDELSSTFDTIRDLEDDLAEERTQRLSTKSELNRLVAKVEGLDKFQRETMDMVAARDALTGTIEAQKSVLSQLQTELKRGSFEMIGLTEGRLRQDMITRERLSRTSSSNLASDGPIQVDRSSSETTDRRTSIPEEKSPQITEQLDQCKQTIVSLEKRLVHCESDLQANIDLVNVLEASLNDSERALRKARLSANDLSKERDRAAEERDTLRSLLSSARAEVLSVKSSVDEDNRRAIIKTENEQAEKENAKKELELKLKELKKRKSKFNCF